MYKKICTLYLPADTFERFKRICRKNETSANKEVTKFMESELFKMEDKS